MSSPYHKQVSSEGKGAGASTPLDAPASPFVNISVTYESCVTSIRALEAVQKAFYAENLFMPVALIAQVDIALALARGQKENMDMIRGYIKLPAGMDS